MPHPVEVHLVESKGKRLCFFPQVKLLCEADDQWWRKLLTYKDYLDRQEDPPRSLKDDVNAMYRGLREAFPRRQWWKTEITTLTLITTDCNMRCSYCYAGQGSYGRDRQVMDENAAARIVELAFTQFPNIKHIRFFGGEPLLNPGVIQKVCRVVRDDLGHPGVKFSLETNGTLVTDEIVKIIKDYHIDLGVSLDGPEGLHDIHRLFPDGAGTHRIVWQNLKRLSAEGVRFGVNCTYTEEHRQIPLANLDSYLRAVSPFYQISPCSLPDSGTVRIGDEYLFYPIRHLLEERPAYHLPTLQLASCVVSESIPEHFCEAQSRLTVFPDGSVFPCELLAGQAFYMGNILAGGFPSSDFHAARELLLRFRRSHIPTRYWFRYLVYPICIANYEHLRNAADLTFPENMGDLYEKLLVVMAELMSDEEGYDKLLEAIRSCPVDRE